MSREGDNVFSKDACLRLELDLPDGQFGPITIDDRGWHEIGRTQFTGIDRLARGIARRKSLGSWLRPGLVVALSLERTIGTIGLEHARRPAGGRASLG